MRIVLTVMMMLLFVAGSQAAQGPAWYAIAGGQTDDKGKQALAFLPNELWVHAGDSITWTFRTDEVHSVTFLTPGQIRPFPPAVGCPGTTPDGSIFDDSACVNSGTFGSDHTYTVNFPTAGNFKLVCLVHFDMTGVVHVLDVSETLPHDQAFYDRQRDNQRSTLFADGSRLERRGIPREVRASGDEANGNDEEDRPSRNKVSAGIGEIVATGGGSQTVSVMRFLPGTTEVHVGDTVEWTNLEAVTGHTVTFGIEPADPLPPSDNVTVDSDGARHAVLGSPEESVNSGAIPPERHERNGIAQAPLGLTRFRVTFMAPGLFNYYCALHDDLGMLGRVNVRP